MITAREAYRLQRRGAISRKLGWYFTFETWCVWWEEHLGKDWLTKRGCKTGQYVMARNGDKGPYAPWNVRCATVAENHVEYNNHRPTPTKDYKRRPSRKEVIAIFRDQNKYVAIAEKYGVGQHQVHCIKTKKYYRKITDQL